MRRQYDLYTLALRIDPADLPRAVESAQKLPQQQRFMALQILASRWSEVDPRAAVTYAARRSDSRDIGLLFTVTSTWAATDAEEAIAFAQALPSGRERTQMMGSLVQSLSAHDPQRALELLKSGPGLRTAGAAT